MNRMKFEGRMNYFMLTAIRSAKNEDGLISDRDLKAIRYAWPPTHKSRSDCRMDL